MPQTTAEPDPEWENVSDDVEWWRLSVLIKAGYEFLDALALASEPTVDIHQACDLLASGCAPETAREILL